MPNHNRQKALFSNKVVDLNGHSLIN